MVRLGIGLYGVSMILQNKIFGKCGYLKSVISQVELFLLESVGYSRKFMAEKPTNCNNPIGYADGISRGWGMALDL
jgi:alanine racemase